ncbi:hypothetical protein [Aeoliella sp.]|uniref:hypothetical protein n=1 Tax=Aeoliella sp. TaxID=2795800 RepID=UPI003CCC32AB
MLNVTMRLHLEQQVAKFDAQNGGDPVYKDGKLIFENGAWRDEALGGRICGPDPNPKVRVQAAVRYWKLKGHYRPPEGFEERIGSADSYTSVPPLPSRHEQLSLVAAQFDKEHGEPVEFKGKLYYEDGSQRDKNPAGVSVANQPRDNIDRQRIALHYWRLRLRVAEQKFEKSRTAIEKQIEDAKKLNRSPNVDEQLQTLEQLRLEVVKARQGLEKYDPAANDQPPTRSKRDREREAELSQEIEEAERQLEKLNI